MNPNNKDTDWAWIEYTRPNTWNKATQVWHEHKLTQPKPNPNNPFSRSKNDSNSCKIGLLSFNKGMADLLLEIICYSYHANEQVCSPGHEISWQ